MKILIRGTNWVGDTVMTIPAVRRLRELFPDASFTLLAPSAAAGILANESLFDDVIPTDTFLNQVRAIRKRRFDLAVIFPNSFRSALINLLGGAKRRFGFASGRRSFLLTDPVDVPNWKDSRHEVFYYLELVAAVEAKYREVATEVNESEPTIAVTEAEHQRAREVLAANGVDLTKPIVAIAAGSTNSRAKRWLPERFADLGDRIREELGANVILMGSKGDAGVSDLVIESSKEPPVDLTGETDIPLATAILSEVDLLISNDMGLAHLAPAVGTATIVIFGPTNPVTTRPFSNLATIVSANVECAPCMLRDCPIDHRCMTRVSVDEVFIQAKKILTSGN
jgi:heptosyltransferase-2